MRSDPCLDGEDTQLVSRVEFGADEHLFVAGTFTGPIGFVPGDSENVLSGDGSKYAFVTTYDRDLSHRWHRGFVGAGIDYQIAIDVGRNSSRITGAMKFQNELMFGDRGVSTVENPSTDNYNRRELLFSVFQ